MRLAVVFLMVFVATSYQQQYQKRLLWMSPFTPQRSYFNRYSSPQYPVDSQQQPPVWRTNRPTVPITDDDDDFGIHPSSPVADDAGFLGWGHPSPYSSLNPRFFYRQAYGIGNRPKSFHNQNPYRFYGQPNQQPFYSDEETEGEIEIINDRQPDDDSEDQYDEIESRRLKKVKPNLKDDRQRWGFGNTNYIALATSSSSNNLFAKTVGYYVTSTVNITSVINCIPRDEFNTSSPTACRRRRRSSFKHFRALEEEELNPTQLEGVESTALPSFRMDDNALADGNRAQSNDFPLASSQPEDTLADEDSADPRGKRSFFFKYTSTTTLTSYTFYTTSITRTVSLASTSSLLCLPCSYSIC